MKKQYQIIIFICVLMVVLFQHDKVLRSGGLDNDHLGYSLSSDIEDVFLEERVRHDFNVVKISDKSDEPKEIARKKTISISGDYANIDEFKINHNLDKAEKDLNKIIHSLTDKNVTASEIGSEDSSTMKQSANGNGDTLPELELPVLSTEKILPVKFKILSQKGRVNIVDIDGNIYLDINSLARYYGKKVDWDSDNEQFVCKLFGVEIRGSSLNYEIFVNGNSVVLDQPVYTINQVTYLPADSFAEEFGAEATYENQLLEFKVRNIAKAAFKLFRS